MSLTNLPHHLSSDAVTPVLAPDTAYRMEPWYEAYMTALFETEKAKVAEEIKRAERLMISRQREIFGQSPATPERKALDKAFHALRALQLCLKL